MNHIKHNGLSVERAEKRMGSTEVFKQCKKIEHGSRRNGHEGFQLYRGSEKDENRGNGVSAGCH